MAKDDYHVIVYKILSYLYRQLKKGEPVDPGMIDNKSRICPVNPEYWKFIIVSMLEEGLVRGFEADGREDADALRERLGQLRITPKGIDLLHDNSMHDKVNNLIKSGAKQLLKAP